MKKTRRICGLLFALAGWTVAASAVHIVRTPGAPAWLGRVSLVTKDRLTFRDTYVDTRHWTEADLQNHPALVNRLNEAHRADLLKHVTESASISFDSPELALAH